MPTEKPKIRKWFKCRDARCTRATAAVCRCSCGGLFHGQDLQDHYTEVNQIDLKFRIIDRTTGEVFESRKVYQSLKDLLGAAGAALVWLREKGKKDDSQSQQADGPEPKATTSA